MEHARLTRVKQLTQVQLGERLSVSYQAVSKWERGETLPDTSLLVDLATVLDRSTRIRPNSVEDGYYCTLTHVTKEGHQP